ncbi:MAG: thiamine phosphate synthase [Candidatus Dormibacteraceae bacterium]
MARSLLRDRYPPLAGPGVWLDSGRPARRSPHRRPRIATKPELIERLLAAHLYFITPDEGPGRIVELVTAALPAADVIQLRHKSLARGEIARLAREIRTVTARAGALFIVNDHVDLAMLSRADGVHLGPDDLSIASARRIAGDDLIIGASASSPGAARAAIAWGADYLGSGPAFPTPLKAEKQVIGPGGVAAIAAAVGPAAAVFAIGGIDESNVAELAAQGLRRACVIRAIAGAPDPGLAARRLRGMLASG